MYALQDAARAAASNDDEHTEQLLVDLLKDRAERGSSSRVRLTTSQAIRAADKLSLEALVGFTAPWALTALQSTEPGIMPNLATASSIASQLVDLGLPADVGWMDECDALGLARVYAIGAIIRRTPYSEMLAARAPVDIVRGLEIAADQQALDALRALNPDLMARPHPLKDGFVILPGETREALVAMLPGGQVTPDLDRIVRLNGYGARDATATDEIAKRISESPVLAEVANWWNSLPPAQPTLTGQVIGFVNTRRHIAFRGAQTIGDLFSSASRGNT